MTSTDQEQTPTSDTPKWNRYYFYYPCSVNAGVDPVEIAKQYLNYKKAMPNSISGWTHFCKELGCTLESDDETVLSNAEGLRKEWGYAKEEDNTMMKEDIETFKELTDKESIFGWNDLFQFATPGKMDNEQVGKMSGFLKELSNGLTKLLCIIGHGLSPQMAKDFENPWKFAEESIVRTIMDKSSEEICKNAQPGDIVVFSMGLLTPEWVVDRLYESADESNKINNEIVIIIDACYSGTWKRRIEDKLTTNPLEHTRIILQTSCGENEESYGGVFMPALRSLHETGNQNNPDISIDQGDYASQVQMPTLYNSKPFTATHDHSQLPQEFPFPLFTPTDFGKFLAIHCKKEMDDPTRGIPENEIENFFKQILENDTNKPKIKAFKLTRYSENKTPMALLLMEWKNKHYQLHVHFNKLPPAAKEISSISHVKARKTTTATVQFKEVGQKCRINENKNQDVLKMIQEDDKFVKYCESFVKEKHDINWDDPQHWDNPVSIPCKMIRSRSAILKERLDLEAKMEACKPKM